MGRRGRDGRDGTVKDGISYLVTMVARTDLGFDVFSFRHDDGNDDDDDDDDDGNGNAQRQRQRKEIGMRMNFLPRDHLPSRTPNQSPPTRR